MRWVELEARAGDKKVHTGLWLGDLKEKDIAWKM